MLKTIVPGITSAAILTALVSVSAAQEDDQPGPAPPVAAAAASDDAATIRATANKFVDAFNRQDAKALAALWTEDGEYLDDAGRRFAGREAIEAYYADQFETGGPAKIRIMIDSVRLLSPDTAIEDGRAVLEPAPPGPPGVSKYAVVHVKVDGTWLMGSVRDAWVESPSGYANVADLDWLIGKWSAEERGVRIDSDCQWVANKSFVERRYTITQPDQSQTAGVQIIGWNADTAQVQSWDFSPDGGHAVGVWSAQPGGWSAEMHGVNGDGTITTSVNLLTKLDDDAYVWKSVHRMAGETSLPDTGEVVLRRQPAR